MADKINRTSYYALLDDLNMVKEWLHTIRLNTTNTRFAKIYRLIKLICQHYQESTLDLLIKTYTEEEMLTVLLDADAFISVHQQFKTLSDNQLPRRRLREALNGPLLVEEEGMDGASIHGRDALFEMHLAARMKARGLNVTGFDDIQFEFLGVPVNVQCKRIKGENAVKRNYKKACSQLTERIKENNGRGLIALSVEKLLGTEEDEWVLPDKRSLVQQAKTTMDNFIRFYEKEWLSTIDIRVLGVIIDFKYKGVVADHNNLLTRGYETALLPICSARTLQFRDYNYMKSLAAQFTNYTEQLG